MRLLLRRLFRASGTTQANRQHAGLSRDNRMVTWTVSLSLREHHRSSIDTRGEPSHRTHLPTLISCVAAVTKALIGPLNPVPAADLGALPL